jgi:hypothetical protein
VDNGRGARPLPRKGLFVIGCPRNGTTILQNALNDSDEVFLFGEPDFHADPGTPDFARRYNDMHRLWGNQPTKSTFCPALLEHDARWPEYLTRLAEHYRYVGSKIVLNPSTFLHDPDHIFDFYSRNFYSSHFIFTFRNPLHMAGSTRAFQALTGGEATPFEMLVASYVAAVSLCIVMLRNLPRVQVVFHDHMTPRTFAQLGKRLELRLSGARRYYDRDKVQAYDPAPILRQHGETAQLALDLYRDFRQAAIGGFDLVQIGQNNASLSPTHLTPLGRLARRCETLSERLAPFGRVVDPSSTPGKAAMLRAAAG